jgi:hypothetical protein
MLMVLLPPGGNVQCKSFVELHGVILRQSEPQNERCHMEFLYGDFEVYLSYINVQPLLPRETRNGRTFCCFKSCFK